MSMSYLVLASIVHLVLAYDGVRIPKAVIGGFFDRNGSMRSAFSLAVRTINECNYDHEICEQMHRTEDGVNPHLYHQVEFSAMAMEVDGDDVTTLHKKSVELSGASTDPDKFSPTNDYGISTVIGPHDRLSSSYMQGLCDSYDIPHIVIRPDLELQHNPVQTINLYPDTNTLATVYIQMIKKMNWGSFSILYEHSENLIGLRNVLKMYKFYTHNIYAFRLGNGPNYSEPLLKAKQSQHKCLLIDCHFSVLFNVLRQAQELGMMSESYKYFVTSLDLQATELWPFRYTGANISGLRLVDPGNAFVSKFVDNHLDDFEIASVDKLLVNDALMFDAVALFAQGYKDFVYKNPIRYGARLTHLDRSPSHPWIHGLSLRNYILYNHLDGLSGPVILDSDGVRRRFKLDVINLHQTGLTKVGTWDPEQGFDELELTNEISMEHFKVLITMNPPYAQKVNHSRSMEGNARYEGFVVDIIKTLAKDLHFNYTFYVQEDSDNGNCTKDETTDHCTCTGMMGKILRNEMDMAITDLTITENRAKCIQFSTAFWNLGMSILYKKPQKAEATWYSFFLPFNRTVWMNLGLSWIIVSFLFFVCGRLSPPEWNNPYPCIEEPNELVNQFTINNAFWFTIGALMQQGSEIAPIGGSTRVLAGSWWFFCLIIVNTYIANLAAFLTIETPVTIVRGIEDLYNQTEIKYGAKKGGSTFTYFKFMRNAMEQFHICIKNNYTSFILVHSTKINGYVELKSSSDPKHKELYNNMIDPEWQKKYMVDTNEKGIELARSTEVNYAFFMESASIEYVQHRKCDLEQAGGLIDHKAYAIGYANNFTYVKEVNKLISKLNENSIIKELYKKWWTEKGAVCGDDNGNMPQPMNLSQLIGVFYVLTGGVLVSLVVTLYEFVLDVQAKAKIEKASTMKTLVEELINVAGSKSVKPVLRKQRSSETNCSDNYSCNLTMTTQA